MQPAYPFTIQRHRDSAPPGIPIVNPHHTLASGLTCVWLPIGKPIDNLLLTTTTSEVGSNIAFVDTVRGDARKLNGALDTNPNIVLGTTAQLFSPNGMSVFIVRRMDAKGNANGPALGFEAAGATAVHVWLPKSDDTVYFDFGGTAGANEITWATGGLSTTAVDRWAFSAGADGSAIWYNGALKASQASAITATLGANNFGLLDGGTGTGTAATSTVCCYTWNRQLTVGEIEELDADPWCFLLYPQDRLMTQMGRVIPAHFWVRINGGDWNNDPAADPATDTGYIDMPTLSGQTFFITMQGSDSNLTLNAGATPFAFAAPSGFTGWPDNGSGFTTLDPTKDYGSAVLSGGDLTLKTPTTFGASQSVHGWEAGKYYFEITNNHNTLFNVFTGGGVSRQYPGIDFNFFANNGQYGSGDLNGGGIVLVPVGFPSFHARISHTGTVDVSSFGVVGDGTVMSVAVKLDDVSPPAPPSPPITPPVGPPVPPVYTTSKTQMADIWFGNPGEFIDLSDANNRRKFITASGCTAYLGANGEVPFGFSPPVFLTVPPGGTPAQFANNYGTAGAYTINNPPLLATATAPCCGTITPGSLTPTPQRKLLIWNGKRWCTSSQDVALTQIATQEINSVQTAWGTDGTQIFPLFQRPSTAFTKTIQSKLFSMPGSIAMNKGVNRFWGAMNYNLSVSPDITLLIDSETGTDTRTLTITPGTQANGLTVIEPTAVGNWGAYLGMTIQTLAGDVTLLTFMMAPEYVQYRG